MIWDSDSDYNGAAYGFSPFDMDARECRRWNDYPDDDEEEYDDEETGDCDNEEFPDCR